MPSALRAIEVSMGTQSGQGVTEERGAFRQSLGDPEFEVMR